MKKNKPVTNIHIAILVRMFPNIVQTYVLNHIVSLKSAGVDTIIIAERNPKQAEVHPLVNQHQLIKEARYIRTEAGGIKDFFLSLRFLNGRYFVNLPKLIFSNIWLKYGINYTIKSIIRLTVMNDLFNIIHSHSLFGSYDYLFLKEIYSIPLITTYHGRVPKGVTKIPDHHQKIVFEKTDAFIVNTEFAKKELLQLGCPSHKIQIIVQGTNLKEFPFVKRFIDPVRKIRLLTVGRLSIEKGHHIVIEALSVLANTHPLIEYHIVGSGPEMQNLTELASEYGMTDRVIFHGVKTGDKLRDILSSAHIFILPSLMETQGVVLQEAQASGLPVIGSRVGGIPEVIADNETGLLFTEADHVDLADKIKKLISNPVFYEKLCFSGREDVENNYDINVICGRLISIYQRLLN